MTTKEAAQALEMTELSLKELMKQGRLQIGYYVKREGCNKGRYLIYSDLVEAEVNRRKGRPQPLSDEDIERIAECITQKLR